jgi:hypothetical protein
MPGALCFGGSGRGCPAQLSRPPNVQNESKLAERKAQSVCHPLSARSPKATYIYLVICEVYECDDGRAAVDCRSIQALREAKRSRVLDG